MIQTGAESARWDNFCFAVCHCYFRTMPDCRWFPSYLLLIKGFARYPIFLFHFIMLNHRTDLRSKEFLRDTDWDSCIAGEVPKVGSCYWPALASRSGSSYPVHRYVSINHLVQYSVSRIVLWSFYDSSALSLYCSFLSHISGMPSPRRRRSY